MKLIFAILLISLAACQGNVDRKFNVGDKVIIQDQIKGVITANWGFTGGMKRYKVQYIQDGKFQEVVVMESVIKKI